MRWCAAPVAVLGVLATAPAALGLGAGGQKANFGSYYPQPSPDGSLLAFWSWGSNLSPDWLGPQGSNPSIAQVYARDLGSGQVTLVSRGSGSAPAANGDSATASFSADNRYVVFHSRATNLVPEDTQGAFEVYVRDMQSGTTTLVSRASGVNGVPANSDSATPSISPDGRYVAFRSFATNLDPVDTDAFNDVYVRDLQANTTTLVSRASGANGAKADWGHSAPGSISNNGVVLFTSAGSNLDADDTDSLDDIFVRYLDTNVTKLVSRATGSAGVKGNARSDVGDITPDGRYATFRSDSTNLVPEGRAAAGNVFVRDLQTNTTTLASRASGASGTPGTEWANPGAISDDGRYVVFFTNSRLDPGDTDPPSQVLAYDVYLRDLQTSTTTLVSRATGANGAKGDDVSQNPSISGDGRFVAFQSEANNFAADDHDGNPDSYVRDMQTSTTYLEGRATPGYVRYVRPRGATPVRVSLVPAFQPCTAPNRTHGSPLSFGSCTPPVAASPNLTIGVGDGNPVPARSIGSLLMKAGTSDVSIAFSLTNVLRTANLSDYTGELQGRVRIRLTDQRNGSSAFEEGTVQDFDLAFTAPCTATSSTLDGATCAVTTTAGSVLPGLTGTGVRAVYGLDQVKVFDGGPDEDADTTADNSLFAVQGVFVP